ncbi:MAG: hypothetical protein K1Y36_18665 [Blastocatellia bacterium]|nr:hypothetical protein [Blastocatellia bacterium]
MRPVKPKTLMHSPLGLVVVVAAITAAVLLSTRIFGVDRVVVEATWLKGDGPATQPSGPKPRDPFPETPIQQTGSRVYETVGLAEALTLARAAEEAEGRIPVTAEAVLAAAVQRNLLPPGVTVGTAGLTLPSQAVVTLRYRSTPFQLEVISQPRENRGATLLVRLPVDSNDPFYRHQSPVVADAALFCFPRSADLLHLPPPLLPEAELALQGWKFQPFTQVETPEGEK